MLVALIIAGLGLLGMVRVALGVTAAQTQNSVVATVTTLSNSFWGVIQANPTVLLTSSLSGTQYNSSNYTSAPPPLQYWLQQATGALPGGAITITTGPDAASGSACAIATGCSVTLEMDWIKVGAPGSNTGPITRKQIFYYQFGL